MVGRACVFGRRGAQRPVIGRCRRRSSCTKGPTAPRALPSAPPAVHHLFLSMSLRHLCVVDSRCRCVGIITRKDLDHAAGSGWWR